MATPAEIPEQDEALRSLVARYKQGTDPVAFAELAAALRTRGRASEALSVVDGALDEWPRDVGNRIERARALLALDRPGPAYVELVRTLALSPDEPQAMRLLGQLYRDRGAHDRAAELLAQPSRGPTTDSGAGAAFSRLTADLRVETEPDQGPEPPRQQSLPQVEVTQVIRRRKVPRRAEPSRTLRSFSTPIVDATQPGRVQELPVSEDADFTFHPLGPPPSLGLEPSDLHLEASTPGTVDPSTAVTVGADGTIPADGVRELEAPLPPPARARPAVQGPDSRDVPWRDAADATTGDLPAPIRLRPRPFRGRDLVAVAVVVLVLVAYALGLLASGRQWLSPWFDSQPTIEHDGP